MNEQERLYAIFKDFGVTREHIQKVINGYLNLGETLDYAIAAVRVALSIGYAVPSEFTLESYATFAKFTPQEVKEQYEQIKEELLIADRYKEHKVSGILVDNLVQDGIKHGFSRKAALVGVRLGLALEYGQHEYFSADEVAEMLGVSLEEAYNLIQQNCNENCNVTKDVFHQFIQ